MSKASDFLGGARKITRIVNQFNVATAASISFGATFVVGTLKILSGALTAGTLATGLSLTGKGCVNFAALRGEDATSRTIRMKITVDGVVVFDPGVTASQAANNTGIVGIGSIAIGANAFPVFQPIYFSSSCLIQIASSLTETDKLALHVNYELHS